MAADADIPNDTSTQIRPARTSTWASASLLCSVVACCPAMTIIGPILGVRALVEIKANPQIGGRKLALAGIAIGSLITLGYVLGMVWWHFNARVPMLNGPQPELRAGLAGDVARFKAGFTGDGAAAPDQEASDLLHEIAARYGRFIDSRQSAIGPNVSPMAGPAEFRISYTFQFDQGLVQAEALFVTFAPARIVPRPVFKWGWLRVIDPNRGDLVYPVSATADALANAPAASQP